MIIRNIVPVCFGISFGPDCYSEEIVSSVWQENYTVFLFRITVWLKLKQGFWIYMLNIYIYIKALYVEIWLDMRLCKILLSVCKTWKKNPENRKKSITKFIQFPCLIFDISGHSIWNFCFSKYDWYSRWKSKLFKSRIILGKYVFLLIF